MNEKLASAESDLIGLLSVATDGATMDDILQLLGDKHAEEELRAAVWTLRAEGLADFEDHKITASIKKSLNWRHVGWYKSVVLNSGKSVPLK